MISIKIHSSYRNVVAVCDLNLIGKKFEEDKKQLDIRENFYKGEECDEAKALEILTDQLKEDSTFNIVGEEAIKIAKKAGIISINNSVKVQDIPFALKLV